MPNEKLGKVVAVIRIRENGVDFAKFKKSNPRIKLLIQSLVERYVTEWETVKNFSESDMKKWNHDGRMFYLYNSDSTEPATLILQNILREKENIEEIGRAYR